MRFYACDLGNEEIWESSKDAMIKAIQNKYKCNRITAFKLLKNATIYIPINLDDILEIWCE